MFLHLGFINYYTTSAVFFFIDDSCFSDVVQCIKSKRSTLSDGLTVGLEKHTGQRKQPMCSNAVSLFSVIAIIICQHPVVGCMLCFGILKNVLRKAWHTTSFFGQKYINQLSKSMGDQIWLRRTDKNKKGIKKKKKGMKVIPVTSPSFHPTCKDAPLQRVRGRPAEGQRV